MVESAAIDTTVMATFAILFPLLLTKNKSNQTINTDANGKNTAR